MVAAELSRPREVIAVVRVLVLLQGAFLLTSTLEAAVFGAALRGGAHPAVVTGAAAVVTFVARTGLAWRARWARRFTIVAEAGIIFGAVLDLVLALVFTGTLPPPVAMLTRLALPAAVMAILLQRPVEEAFAPAERRGTPSGPAESSGGSAP